MFTAKEAFQASTNARRSVFDFTMIELETTIKAQIDKGYMSLSYKVPYYLAEGIINYLINLGYEVRKDYDILTISWENK